MHLKPVLALRQFHLAHNLHHARAFFRRAAKGHHHVHILESVVAAHLFDGLTFQPKGRRKLRIGVARGAAPAEHGIFFLGLIFRAADKRRVLVGLKVGKAHYHIVGPEGGPNLANALSEFAHKEGDFVVVAGSKLVNLFFEGARLERTEIDERERMNPDVRGDNEFLARKPYSLVGEEGVHKCALGTPHVEAEFSLDLGDVSDVVSALLPFQLAFVHAAHAPAACVNSDKLSRLDFLCGVPRSDDCGDAKLAADDCRVRGAPAFLGDDGGGNFHNRLPVGVGNLGNENFAGLELVELCGLGNDTRLARNNFGAYRDALHHRRLVGMQRVVGAGEILFFRLHGLGTRLHNVELPTLAILGPFHIHRYGVPCAAAVMLLNLHAPAREREYLVISEHKTVALFWRNFYFPYSARGGVNRPFTMGRVNHLDCFRA